MIYCVEDEQNIREIILYTLKSTGFEAEGFEESISFFKALKKQKPALILLDIMLPNTDGVDILRMLKEDAETASIPVIMATAKGTEYDKIKSLDMGADDYLVKPFGMMEMVSRIKAVLRRATPKDQSHTLCFEQIVMNLDEHIVYVNAERIDLTYKEFNLLHVFLSHPNMVFTRTQLFTSVWSADYLGEERTVDMHVSTLRQKLQDAGKCIKTVRGVGYRMEKSV